MISREQLPIGKHNVNRRSKTFDDTSIPYSNMYNNSDLYDDRVKSLTSMYSLTTK